MRLALSRPEQVVLHSNSNTTSNMYHKWKETIDIVCKTTNGNHREPTPGEKSHRLQRSLISIHVRDGDYGIIVSDFHKPSWQKS